MIGKFAKRRGLFAGFAGLAAIGLTVLVTVAAEPSQGCAQSLVATIDLSDQQMTVRRGSRTIHTWPVSTARSGYRTPVGTYRPIRLERMWYSRKYDWAPMPHSIFFHGGYAIHGTTDLANLGRPASHGCVRLHPDNARTLFNMVVEHGRAATSIVVQR